MRTPAFPLSTNKGYDSHCHCSTELILLQKHTAPTWYYIRTMRENELPWDTDNTQDYEEVSDQMDNPIAFETDRDVSCGDEIETEISARAKGVCSINAPNERQGAKKVEPENVSGPPQCNPYARQLGKHQDNCGKANREVYREKYGVRLPARKCRRGASRLECSMSSEDCAQHRRVCAEDRKEIECVDRFSHWLGKYDLREFYAP